MCLNVKFLCMPLTALCSNDGFTAASAERDGRRLRRRQCHQRRFASNYHIIIYLTTISTNDQAHPAFILLCIQQWHASNGQIYLHIFHHALLQRRVRSNLCQKPRASPASPTCYQRPLKANDHLHRTTTCTQRPNTLNDHINTQRSYSYISSNSTHQTPAHAYIPHYHNLLKTAGLPQTVPQDYKPLWLRLHVSNGLWPPTTIKAHAHNSKGSACVRLLS